MKALLILATIAVLGIGAILRPDHARCPSDWDLRTGVQRDGSFTCWPHPVGDPEWDGTWQREERSVQASWVLEGRVYCAGRTPVVEDWQKVGCR